MDGAYVFGNVLGNAPIKRAMKASVARGRVSHAYIICGGTGFGKSHLGNAFAKAILCRQNAEGGSCDACKSCLTFETGNNPDINHIISQKSTMGVEQMRDDILSTLATQPHFGQKRVFVIHAAHKMTAAAQNAMLLTLEEAPKHTVFLLLSDGLGSFLPTLLSRCITYKMQPLSAEIIQGELMKKGIDEKTAKAAAEFSGGSVGRALTMAQDEDFALFQNFAINLIDKLPKMGIPDIFATAKSMEQYKDQIGDVLDIFQMQYRQEMLAATRQGNADAAKTILHNIKHIDDTKHKLSANCNFLLCMEVLMINLAQIAPKGV